MFSKTPSPDHYTMDYFVKSYQNLDKFLDREKKALSYINPRNNDVVLDVGCGRGTLVKELGRLGHETIGIDASRVAVMISNKNLCGISKAHIVRASATHLPFRNDAFNKAAVLEVLEHLCRKDTLRCIEEICRALKEGGSAVISTPHMEFPISFLSKVYRVITASKFASLHVDEKSYRIMYKLLSSKGFCIKMWLEDCTPRGLKTRRKDIVENIASLLKYPTPFLSSQMWIICYKKSSR